MAQIIILYISHYTAELNIADTFCQTEWRSSRRNDPEEVKGVFNCISSLLLVIYVSLKDFTSILPMGLDYCCFVSLHST